MESTKLKIPDDWDGTKETWPLFKMHMEMACQKVNMTFLTMDATTTELTANTSKMFAESDRILGMMPCNDVMSQMT